LGDIPLFFLQPDERHQGSLLIGIITSPPEIFGSTGTGVMLTPSTGINVVNKIKLLRNPLLIYQYFNNGIKSKKQYFFDLDITTCKTTNK
jgi:hypothetical protein